MAAPSRAAARRAAAAPPLLVLLLLLAMAGSAAAARPEPKGAKITLRAKWPGTPLLHEAAEFLADEDPALFWRFVEGWQASAPSQLGAAASPEQCWAGIRSAAAPHLSAGMARLLDASLAARQYSPRLEMFRQLADASRSEAAPTDGGGGEAAAAGEAPAAPCCWALLGGKAFTAAAPLATALETALAAAPSSHQELEEGGAGAVYSFDHIYSPRGSTAPPLNITAPGTVPVELFAPVGSRCAGELHAVLAAAAARSEAAAAAATDSQQAPPRLAYAWRPVLGGSGSACAAADEVHPCTRLGTEGPLVLPGYGVELALKNMEYNAQDDSKKPAGGEEKAAEEEAGDEEAAAQPEAEGGSEPEKAGASAPALEDGVMKVKLKALGLQATQRVLNAAAAGGNGTAALDALQEAAQDFPRLVEQLSGLKYSKNLRLAVEGLQRFIPPGSQFLLLNGLVYGTRDFNLYSFLDALRREVRLYDALRSAGLPPAQLREAMLLRSTAVGNNEPPRLRLPTDQFVLWVNDLERDERYASWPRELQTLLMPMYPGRLPTIARNVLTAVFLFDPATPAALEIGSMAHQLEQQGWPVRIGLVPVVPARVARLRGGSGARSHSAPSISEQMARLLSAVSHAHGGTAVTQLLYEVRSTMPPDLDEAEDFGVRLWGQASMVANARWSDWSEEAEDDDDEEETRAAQVLKAAAAADNGEALAAIDAAAAKLLDGAAELAYNAGLAGPSRSGVLVFNGAVTVNDGNGWQGAIVGALQAQMQIVQEDIYMQRLTDAATDVQEEILRLHGAIPRYNPRIMPLDGGGPGFLRISGESEEYPARQLALTGPLLGLNATAAPGRDSPSEAGLWVRYFGPQPSLVDEDDEGPQGSQQHLASVTHWVAADVTSRQGLRLVAAALQYRSSSGRVAVLVNSAGAAAGGDSKGQRLAPIERLMVAVSSGLLQTDLTDFADALDSVLQQAEAPCSLSLEQLDELGQFGGRLAADLDALSDKLAAAAASQARFVRSALGLGPGACAVVTNGRLLELPPAPTSSSAAAGPASTAAAASAEEEHSLEPHDFELLELYAAQHQYSEQVATLVRDAHQAGALAGADASAVAAMVSSALAAATPEEVDQRSGRVTDLVRRQASQRNALTLPRPSGASSQGADAEGAPAEGSQPGDSAEVAPPPVVVHAVLNPLSKAAQRLAPLIGFLRELLDAEALVLLNPKREYDDMPLKTFYRYVLPQLPPAATGREDGDSAGAAQAAAPSAPPAPAAAEFSGLPPNKVLTLGMDEPESWLVEPVEAASDLDNLRLQELGEAPAMEATYELEALMLTGMCLDLASLAARIRDQIHPRGVQLELAATNAPAAAPPLVDTLVMSNLGYFQLKSRPGLWKLRLAPGRSQELYTIASSTGASSGQKAEAAVAGADAHQVPVALSSFSGKHMHLFLRKDADRLTEDVLTGNATDDGSKGSLWDRVSAWRGGGSGKGGAPARLDAEAGAEDDRETIHVFTVASGHMYERLQKIMILSATKRTPARIKFWFIKNYMSPQMKAFVPYMARKYDFDYEFVTYKWPSWLHKQTEKQRIIWAYKILFLDVLFPLGLKKVIFCDSDQVVRADLRELWHMDLQGAPYGYTPFCDNNRDMEGFRFWKQGFWKDHLQGKPYHISALYVVDLERFRQIAAGDRLRVMYDGLSKDPNSLSNLDQDLPNYAQHTVPIFSLPQEWLWCETWCGSDTRPQAKTIDLCNNPLTKEPKLQSARRIIAEWPALNREAEEFTAAVERVQRGELSEAALMEDQSLFHVKLTPMAEGVAWSSDATQAAQQASASDNGADSGGHDEL